MKYRMTAGDISKSIDNYIRHRETLKENYKEDGTTGLYDILTGEIQALKFIKTILLEEKWVEKKK